MSQANASIHRRRIIIEFDDDGEDTPEALARQFRDGDFTIEDLKNAQEPWCYIPGNRLKIWAEDVL